MTNTEPVLTNGSAAAVGAALVPILIEIGINADQAGRIGSYVGAALAFILVAWHLFSARSKVIPTVKLPVAAPTTMLQTFTSVPWTPPAPENVTLADPGGTPADDSAPAAPAEESAVQPS